MFIRTSTTSCSKFFLRKVGNFLEYLNIYNEASSKTNGEIIDLLTLREKTKSNNLLSKRKLVVNIRHICLLK